MTDDHVIDIRRYLDQSIKRPDLGAFAVWGGGGERSRFALPVWRTIGLVGGDWGGIVSVSKCDPQAGPRPFFILDLKQDPARTVVPDGAFRLLVGEEVPALSFTPKEGLVVMLGENAEWCWFLHLRGVTKATAPEGKSRETLLFLAGECAGLLFFRELATPLPSSSSTP
jgi:hypothetical protein